MLFVKLEADLYLSRLDNKSHGRASTSSDAKAQPAHAPDSDTDSMAEYGEGDTGTHGRHLSLRHLKNTACLVAAMCIMHGRI